MPATLRALRAQCDKFCAYYQVEKAPIEETKPAAAEAAEASKTEDANALPWPWMVRG